KTAYRQWSRFEEFPRFMEGVVGVERLSGGRLLWHDPICGNDTECYALITEDTPNKRIAWCSEAEALNAGVVNLQPIGESHTRIDLRVEYDPEGVVKTMGYKFAAGSEQVQRDLEFFKEIVEDIAEDAALSTTS